MRPRYSSTREESGVPRTGAPAAPWKSAARPYGLSGAGRDSRSSQERRSKGSSSSMHSVTTSRERGPSGSRRKGFLRFLRRRRSSGKTEGSTNAGGPDLRADPLFATGTPVIPTLCAGVESRRGGMGRTEERADGGFLPPKPRGKGDDRHRRNAKAPKTTELRDGGAPPDRTPCRQSGGRRQTRGPWLNPLISTGSRG